MLEIVTESQTMTTNYEITVILVTFDSYLEKLQKFHPVIAVGCRITYVYILLQGKNSNI
jgi:hypothetical protein